MGYQRAGELIGQLELEVKELLEQSEPPPLEQGASGVEWTRHRLQTAAGRGRG